MLCSVLGKRNSSELDIDSIEPDELKRQIYRLAQDNSNLKQALTKSQEEVKKLKAVIELHESQKKSKEDKSQSRCGAEKREGTVVLIMVCVQVLD